METGNDKLPHYLILSPKQIDENTLTIPPPRTATRWHVSFTASHYAKRAAEQMQLTARMLYGAL